MAELIDVFISWFMGLGEEYGVNPIIFGSIYIGAIPFFTLSIGWLVKNYRSEKSLILPALSSIFFFISAYLYLIVAGENVPLWVYGLASVMIAYGAYATYKKVKNKVEDISTDSDNSFSD